MVVGKLLEAAKWTGETLKGAAVTLASPNAPIPDAKMHPRMMARPWTAQEYMRMWSWRYNWKFLPVFRFYIYSGLILYGVYKFVLPIKPRHHVAYTEGYQNHHDHEVHHWYGIRQKNADAEYFKKYNPLKKEGEVDVGHH